MITEQILKTVDRPPIYCSLASASLFIPIPFLDDYVIGRIHRIMGANIAYNHGISKELINSFARLVKEPKKAQKIGCTGCIIGTTIFLFKKVFWYIIKKIIKKIVFVFTIRDMFNMAIYTYQLNFILSHIIRRYGWTNAEDEEDFQLAVHQTLKQNNNRDIESIFKHAFRYKRYYWQRAWYFIKKGKDEENQRSAKPEFSDAEKKQLAQHLKRLIIKFESELKKIKDKNGSN
ncbi:MAG: hypothetical protein MK193_02895 [Lentisphaeria bacterium]|nr:hypothetical protein [Lentisphaeria bacterium]